MSVSLMKKRNKNDEKNIRLEEISKNEWRFVYSESFNTLIMDVFDNAAFDLLESGEHEEAAIIFRQFMSEVPEFVDSYNHLYLILLWSGKEKAGRVILEKGIENALTLFPENFFEDQHRLEWGWMENRPFLRSYSNLGLSYFDNKQFEKAKIIYERILVMNPNDNQGVRDPLFNCYLNLNLLDAAENLCNRYKDDMMPGIAYGRILISLKLGKQKAAEKHLKFAIRYLPRIANELIKSRHVKPKDYDKWPGIAVGSQAEAYEYWVYYGKRWKEEPGAILFLKNVLAKNKQNKIYLSDDEII